VAARSKAWVCGCLLAGVAGSNPAGDMVVCLLGVLCVVRQRSLQRGGHLSREVLPIVVCLSVISNPQQWGGPVPLGLSGREDKIILERLCPLSVCRTFIPLCVHMVESNLSSFDFLLIVIFYIYMTMKKRLRS